MVILVGVGQVIPVKGEIIFEYGVRKLTGSVSPKRDFRVFLLGLLIGGADLTMMVVSGGFHISNIKYSK